MAEYIDIYDANLVHRGVMERIAAHKAGEWHRTFHCWVVSSGNGGQVLFQKRSDTMRNYPGLLDVSAAGHLEAGEPITAGIREVTEELGIEVNPAALYELGERVEVADQPNGQRNREYQSVFMLLNDASLDEYKPDSREVSSLLWLPITDGFRLLCSEVKSIRIAGRTFERSTGSSWEPTELEITRQSFLPRIQRYYLTSLIMAQRLLSGQLPVAIS